MGDTETRPPTGRSGFEHTVKDFWLSRPRRPRSGRTIAGVAAGVGNRYGIDPVVVRVALVAATVFGGIGLVVYLLGWLFFPEEGDEVSGAEGLLGRGRSSMSGGFAVLLGLVLIPLTSWTFGGSWFAGGGFLGLALMLAALYLLHRSRGEFNRPAPVVRDQAEPVSPMAAAAASARTPDGPPEWDPLGAAPFAWDLPDPNPPVTPAEPAPVPARRSKIGVLAFAVALLVAGVGTALHVNGEEWFSVPHIIGLSLAVLGLGMVAGSFVRGGRGLVGLAIPLAIAGIAFSAVPADSLRGGVGEFDFTPRSAAEVAPVYEHAAGDVRLDLTKLPDSTPVNTTIRNGAGDVTVLVPRAADVTYTCLSRVGDTDCLGRSTSGLGSAALTGEDRGTGGGPRITLDVQNGAGSVEVRRG